jgi:hypothetical protein
MSWKSRSGADCSEIAAQDSAHQRCADGQYEADRDDQQQHADNVRPGVGIFRLELLLMRWRHVLPDVRGVMRFGVMNVRHGCYLSFVPRKFELQLRFASHSERCAAKMPCRFLGESESSQASCPAAER